MIYGCIYYRKVAFSLKIELLKNFLFFNLNATPYLYPNCISCIILKIKLLKKHVPVILVNAEIAPRYDKGGMVVDIHQKNR